VKAVFLDRDGVINELVYHQEAGVIDSPFIIEQFRLRPHVGEAIKLLNQAGYKTIVVSNQPGVAKNHFTLDTLKQIDVKMIGELRAQGAFLDRVYYCTHHPDGHNGDHRLVCSCRKPQPGMLLQAAKEFTLDLSQCYMVGDNLTDVKAGKNAGCRTLLVGKTKCELCHVMDEEGVRPDVIVSDLLEAAKIILQWEEKHGDLHRFSQCR